RLEPALRGFLAELQSGTLSDRWVDSEEQERHSFYYSSLRRGAEEKSSLVLKSYPKDDGVYAVTIAFFPKEAPFDLVSRIVEIEAVPDGLTFRFRSPFESRAQHLASHTLRSVTFHSSGAFDRERAERFVEFKEEFERSTGVESEPLDYYCFHSLDALLKTFGLVHDASKCNFLQHDLGFFAEGGRRYITGTSDERYLFGYVRGLLERRAEDPSAFYAPYATGIAAFYGGYSLSGDSVETLAQQLRDEHERRPDLNFLEEFRKGRKSSVQRHFTYYVLCAFLFGEIEERHSVRVALEPLNSGAEGERFFEYLETRLGVDESGFHDLIVELIHP
ncbi:MAG: hypothetical protein AAF368_17300, partial [Planctomycetota bacterium]